VSPELTQLSENDMGLSVKKLPNGLYEASLTPPYVKVAWTTPNPLPARDLVTELQARGCYQQDVTDAMYEQDPDWIKKLPPLGKK
jgi:hypothetical protein